jgi:inosine-uridine nucleoside N-ribohydrolase
MLGKKKCTYAIHEDTDYLFILAEFAIMSKRKVVIDCDPGNDDAVAIFMALSDPEIDVKAITCVEGNTRVRQTGLNALRALEAANRLDVNF